MNVENDLQLSKAARIKDLERRVAALEKCGALAPPLKTVLRRVRISSLCASYTLDERRTLLAAMDRDGPEAAEVVEKLKKGKMAFLALLAEEDDPRITPEYIQSIRRFWEAKGWL